ncbi:RNA-directed DNA polymerase, eukaryota [Tanacetum coccineum]
MRTFFPSAHSPFTRFSKQRRKGGQQVPRALCPTHLSRSKCSLPVPPNAPICRQRSCECAVMLRMLLHRIVVITLASGDRGQGFDPHSFQGLEYIILKSSKKGTKAAHKTNDSGPTFSPGFTPQSSCHSENVNDKDINDINPTPVSNHVANDQDPFGLEYIILKSSKKGTKAAHETNDSGPTFSPGFTPQSSCHSENVNDKDINDINPTPVSNHVANDQVETSINKSPYDSKNDHVDSMAGPTKPINGFSVLERFQEFINIGQAMGYGVKGCEKDCPRGKEKKQWVKTLCHSNQVNFLSLQETKMVSFDIFVVKAFWGNMFFDFATSSARGRSGGILCVWDKMMFHKKRTYSFDHCLCIEGTWLANNSDLLFISVYSPQELPIKRALWSYLIGIINRWHGEIIVMGDFNEVRNASERHGFSFHPLNTAKFNMFIANAQLIDIPLGGYSFTWSDKHASKMSKLDRFLVSNGVLDLFPNLFSDPGWNRAPFDISFPKRLDYDQSCDLECEVTCDEIKRVVWDCGSDKSPGLDGFIFEFFKKFWSIVGGDVCNAVKEFFWSSAFPKGCNPSFIALTPKVVDAKHPNDFRPISLIGCQYKFIGKILTNRLSLVIDDIISHELSAFIKGRQIMDGPLILNELISWCKTRKEQAVMFKVDFQKAFDLVRWDHLDDILGKFGFGNKWHGWIRGCLHSSKASVLVNGSSTNEFYFHRGLRQSDPLSPFFFILIMESLHVSFQRLINSGMFVPISVRKDNVVPISHLFYADEAMFIGKWSCSNVNILMVMFHCFFLASGLKVNVHKSSLYGVGVRPSDIRRMADHFGCLANNLPFIYLGIKWKAKTLSAGGRLTLIISVLGAIPTYYMSLFKVSEGILSHLEGPRNNFFLGADQDDRKITWVCWCKVMAHKNHGGLGLNSLYALNLALMFKWI